MTGAAFLPLLAVAVLCATKPAGRWIRGYLNHLVVSRRQQREQWAASRVAWQRWLEETRVEQAFLAPVRSERDAAHEAAARTLRPWQRDVSERAR